MTTQVDDELWSAIGDPSRRRVLDLLVSHGEVSASWLAGHVPFSRQAVSKHLVVLEEAGLVSRRKQGREVLYRVEAGRLDPGAMDERAQRVTHGGACDARHDRRPRDPADHTASSPCDRRYPSSGSSGSPRMVK